MNWEKERLLIKVAKMYYEEQLTQSEISKKLGIYRTTISRLIQHAKEQGIVQVSIMGNFKEQVNIEEKLLKHFPIKDVFVLPSSENENSEERRQKISQVAINILNDNLIDDDIVGFSWGNSVGSSVNLLGKYNSRKVDFIPIVGGPGKMQVNQHINAIVYSYARAFGGTPHFIDAPAILESKKTKDEIFESSYFQNIIELWERLTIAIIGIGSIISSSNLVYSGILNEQDIKVLKEKKAIGDICLRFFDKDGNVLDTEINDRTICIQLEKLKNLKCSIGLAESIEKTESIVGALRGGYITHLVTNEMTALSILDFLAKEKVGE